MSHTLERLSTALVSDDLELKVLTRGDLDWVIALGSIGQRHRQASALLHVELAGSIVSLGTARKATLSIARKLNERRKWELGRQDLLNVAAAALRMWLLPVCDKCHGVRYQLIPGTPMLSSTPCPRCKGSGFQPYPIRHSRKISEVVHALTTIRDLAAYAVTAKMRG